MIAKNKTFFEHRQIEILRDVCQIFRIHYYHRKSSNELEKNRNHFQLKIVKKYQKRSSFLEIR